MTFTPPLLRTSTLMTVSISSAPSDRMTSAFKALDGPLDIVE